MSDQKEEKNNTLFYILGVVCLLIAFVLALIVGRYEISLKDLFNMIFVGGDYEIQKSVIMNLRLPRTIIALLTGIALSLSGLLYQETFQNKLVSPDLLGVSTGSGVGASIALLFGLSSAFVSVFAFVVGIATVLLTLTLSKVFQNRSQMTLVLAGVIVGGLMSAILSFIKYFADEQTVLVSITFWLMGSFSDSVMKDVYIMLPIVLVCSTIIFILRWRINLVALGEEEATSKGINYKAYRLLIIGISTLLTASSVAFSGTISWIGLVVPHIVRLIMGRNTKQSIPLTIIFGGTFMILADIISRSFTSAEIPLSAVTGLFGTVIFVIILIAKRRENAIG